MKFVTVTEQAATFGVGAVLSLTPEQVARRLHQLEVVKEGKERTVVRLTQPSQFKIGEQLGVEGDVPKTLTVNLDENADTTAKVDKATKASKAALEKARDKGFGEGRKQMLAEVLNRNSVLEAEEMAEQAVEEAEAALRAETDAEKRKPLEVAVAEAQKRLIQAQAKVAELPALEA